MPPDVAVCGDCVYELFDPPDHRYRYPFITCANCGPRFTIIRGLPYDRANTTMAGFELCPHCARQYHDPADRRFHAQPLACSGCGPHLTFVPAVGGEATDGSDDDVIADVQRSLARGEIVAVKGLGGYHLAGDARNDAAVGRLRDRKQRPDKPFAVMVADLDAARAAAELSDAEEALLGSPARPIVLVRGRTDSGISSRVAPGHPLLGLMLAYTPLHHLLFRPVPGCDAPVPTVLVMTSGNHRDEPLAYDDHDARRRLGALVDSWCLHDRPIHVPCDDSVLRVVGGRPLPIRRARGYAPLPVSLPGPVAPTLAVGAELKNTFCVARGGHAWVSQHIGDMGNIETMAAFEQSVGQFREMYAIDPEGIVADAHPGYATHAWAHDHAASPLLVQHHHAHVCALMAEAGIPASERVIGVAFDGTGYGLDGTIWGGEVLITGYDRFERFAALVDVPLPGGDAAIRNPYRVALAHLWAAGIDWDERLAPVAHCPRAERRALQSMLERGTGCVPTSSMGRLFDAVSSLLGVRHTVTYEGQAAMGLEHLAADAPAPVRRLRYDIDASNRFHPAPVLAGIVDGLAHGESPAGLAAAYHDATAAVVVDAARLAREHSGLCVVGLTGGVFQNALLAASTSQLLTDDGFRVITHEIVPPNDGGLALGQAVIGGSVLARRAARADTG